jgi:glycosyltransferase involved in cell wall biosynthesis
MRSLGNGFELRYTADRDGKHLQYPLPENCTCLGRLTGKSLVDAYQEADALFLPSRMEGLSLSLLEAMASGLPVIATRVSSFPEVVEHGITGWLCQTHEPEEFVLAFRKLAADTDTWQKMNNEARRIVVERFDEKEMVERYLSIYQSIAA